MFCYCRRSDSELSIIKNYCLKRDCIIKLNNCDHFCFFDKFTNMANVTHISNMFIYSIDDYHEMCSIFTLFKKYNIKILRVFLLNIIFDELNIDIEILSVGFINCQLVKLIFYQNNIGHKQYEFQNSTIVNCIFLSTNDSVKITVNNSKVHIDVKSDIQKFYLYLEHIIDISDVVIISSNKSIVNLINLDVITTEPQYDKYVYIQKILNYDEHNAKNVVIRINHNTQL